MKTCDYLVVGAGIIGLAIAREVLINNPKAKVIVIDKENEVGLHASGRNSGVLHAGFYYSPDSLKAKLTKDGNHLLRQFCKEHDIPVKNVGKVVVTKNAQEEISLQELFRRGKANGVEIEIVDKNQLKELEPRAKTHEKALWSPNTGSASPLKVIKAMEQDFKNKGGEILLHDSFIKVSKDNLVELQSGIITAGHVINTAGLYADKVAHKFGFGHDYRMLPFKGLYWYAPNQTNKLTRHIYPIPDPRNPFLGVHLTVTDEGKVKIGPTAIPALWRENYRFTKNFRIQELFQVAKDLPRMALSPHHDFGALLKQELPKYSRRYLIKQAALLAEGIKVADFNVRGQSGIRAQLFDLKQNKLEMDFVIQGDQNSTHVLNAVSPAWTCALSFAKHVYEFMNQNSQTNDRVK
jgi:L-2-hydroxyglutarate oxidase LhgO